MLSQKDRKEQQSARGNLTTATFVEKFNFLKNRWTKWTEAKGDTQAGRLMAHIFTNPTSPKNIALVADNINYIQQNSKNYSKDDLQEVLRLACLCGSESVGKFLIQKLNIDFTNGSGDFVLSYASASGNQQWILELAKAMKEKGQSMPDDVYFLCDDSSLRDRIKGIFEEGGEHRKRRSLL